MQNIQWRDDRLYPVRYHSRYTMLTGLRKALKNIIDNGITAKRSDFVLVDLGCGTMPYRPLFKNLVSRYVGIDILSNTTAPFYFDKYGKSPLEDKSADIVLSTQVLEHVEKPDSYLLECHRIMKLGGKLILSTHGYWPYHPDPHDYWRWTCEGLQKQVEEAGFRIIQFDGVLSLKALTFQMLQDIFLPCLPDSIRYIRYVCAALFQLIIQFVDRFSSVGERRKNAWVFVLLAEKP